MISLVLHLSEFNKYFLQPHRKTSTGAKKQEQLAHFTVAHNPKLERLLTPQSASAPNSPRLPHRALPITVTSSASVKVSKPSADNTPSPNKARQQQTSLQKEGPITRKRSKSPNPRR